MVNKIEGGDEQGSRTESRGCCGGERMVVIVLTLALMTGKILSE